MSPIVDMVPQPKPRVAGVEAMGHEPPSDPLLECLGIVARRLGRPFSGRAVRAGLPLAPGEAVSVPLLARGAEDCGLKADLLVRKPSEVSSLVVPFVMPTKDGGAVVVVALKPETKTARIVVPGHSPDERNVAFADLDQSALGTVVLMAPREPLSAQAAERSDTAKDHWFWGGMARQWPSWLQVGVAAFMINVLGLAVPLYVMSVYDRVIPNHSEPTLWALTIGVLLAFVFDLALKQLRSVVVDQAGGLVEMTSSARLFRQVLAMPMAERGASPGALASQVRDLDTVREFFASSSIVAFTDFVFIGLIIGVLFLIVGPLAWVPLAALPIVLGLTFLLQWPVGRSARAAQAHAGRRHAVLVESLGAIETLKGVAAEGVMQRRWEDAVAASARTMASSRFWSSLNINLIGVVQQLVTVAIVVWGVFLSIEGQITVGGIIAASMLAARVLAPLGNIAAVLSRAQSAIVALRGLNDLMQKPAENSGAAAGGVIQDGGLEFRDVSFIYPGAPVPALNGVSFKIADGERVGLLGRIGSGKSTIGKLADGLWTPASGLILIGGQEIRSLEAADIRSHVGLLSQEVELFSGTIYDNITLGLAHVDEAAVVEACAVAGVADFVQLHPHGLKMAVGDRGRALSGGQRQAVALARTLVRKPRILVLDEPSSALDIASEADLVRRLKGWVAAHGVTLLISSQRLSMLELCDRLVVLDQGRVVADGPRSDILTLLQSRPTPAAATKT